MVLLKKWWVLVMLASMLAFYSQPIQLECAAQRLSWLNQNSPDSATDLAGLAMTSMGVLERRFRFRPRLNTHLLMLKRR